MDRVQVNMLRFKVMDVGKGDLPFIETHSLSSDPIKHRAAQPGQFSGAPAMRDLIKVTQLMKERRKRKKNR